jgi:NADH dehydrogenase
MSELTRIVILGGGYGGVETARLLNKRYKKDPKVEITLIDRNPYHTLMTELHEVAGSRTEPEAVQISFQRIFGGTKVRLVTDNIEGIDFQAKALRSATATYRYDYLVMGTGGEPEFFGTPGVQENSFTLWSLNDALRIREHVDSRFVEAAREHDVARRKALLTFAVAGAGFTGIELIGELFERADTLCRQYNIDRDEVRLVVIEAKDCILPILEPKPREAAHRYLLKKKVEVLVNAPIVKAEEGAIHLKDGTVINAGTFVWTCGIHASSFTAGLELTKGHISRDRCAIVTATGLHGHSAYWYEQSEAKPVGDRGRIMVHETLKSVDHPDVYLCGDMIWLLHDEKPLPQIVETALQTAEVVAHNIVHEIDGKPADALKKFKPNYHGFMVSIGSHYAVAHVMGMNLYSIFAMGMKHLVNLHYLWGVAGVNSCWGYLQEEFFAVRNRRSFIGGHAAAKVPAYWTLLLRLWLGFSWGIEALNKIGEGWFNFDAGTKSGWMFSKGVVQAGVDAAAAATAEAGEGGDADAVGTVVEAAPSFNLDVKAAVLAGDNPLVVWFRTTFMDGIFAQIPYQILQVMVVSTELAIGLAFLGGFLTFPVAVLSIGMCFMFTLSGLFAWNQLWFIFAAIAMMGGAGKILGLDYWVMPWLKDCWNGNRWVQRRHWFVGEPRIRRKKA